LFFHPEGAVIVFFLGIISIGSILLAMPISSSAQEGVEWIDAAFMAVSAACVTGLAVLDISKDFTFTGQLILVILVQIGGLGIMFLSSLALLFVGQKLSLKQEATLMSVFGARLRGEVKFVLRRILAMAFSIEALGIFILTAHFAKQGSDFGDALWKGTFLAISAFCNAGFFIHTQNLIPFAQDPLVLQVVGWLIVLGGLSPGFIFAFPTLWKKSRNISLQFRFIAVATIFLLTFGTLMQAGLEWNRTLAPFGFWDKLNNAWFHSVTARTAGFNSIDLSQTSPASQVILILLMFIGGAPGSTAGGVKVTTFMVIVFTVWSTTLGRSTVQAFSRHIPSDTVLRSTTIFIMGGGICFSIFLSLLLTQPNIPPLMALFEVVSALGTVGLSAGATPLLDSIGKSLIMLCMFLGRIGPLSIAVFFAYNTSRRSWNLPDEDVTVG
jgi:trk system potassium uptake protein TrkH